jgi:uncharacterized protein (DUF427 family)
MTKKAVWQGEIVAESGETIQVEGNHYFPEASVQKQFFAESDTTSLCPWKGTAHYKSLQVGGETNPDAAWYYPDPKPEAEKIRGYFAFWRGVEVVEG